MLRPHTLQVQVCVYITCSKYRCYVLILYKSRYVCILPVLSIGVTSSYSTSPGICSTTYRAPSCMAVFRLIFFKSTIIYWLLYVPGRQTWHSVSIQFNSKTLSKDGEFTALLFPYNAIWDTVCASFPNILSKCYSIQFNSKTLF